MRVRLKQIKWQPLSLSQIYVLSLVAVMLFLLIRKGELLIQTSFLSEASLNTIKEELTRGNKKLFLYILKERAAIILALFVLSTTYLGGMFVYLNVIWYGAVSGLLLTIALLRYGMKGILLIAGGALPHYLIYVPAVILALRLSREKRTVNSKFCIQLFVLLAVIVAGCLLECYVNPFFVVKILKNF